MHRWLLLIFNFEQVKETRSHFDVFEQVKNSSYFADFKRLKKGNNCFLTLNKSNKIVFC